MSRKPNLERATYTVPEAASLLGISLGKAYEAVRAGTIPAIRVGRRFLIPRAAFERWLDLGSSAQPRAQE